jgi:hypothetical protein
MVASSAQQIFRSGLRVVFALAVVAVADVPAASGSLAHSPVRLDGPREQRDRGGVKAPEPSSRALLLVRDGDTGLQQ